MVGLGLGLGISKAVAAGGRTPDGSLRDVVDSTCFDLDITQADSYDGTSQVWENIVTDPADGAIQTAYDQNRGATSSPSTDDPTYNGTGAGDQDSFWSFDGGDFFSLVGVNTTLLDCLHKQGTGETPWWMGFAFNRTDATWSNQDFLMGTRNSAAGDGQGVYIGFRALEVIEHLQSDGSVSSSQNSSIYASPAGDHIIIVSHDPIGNTTRFWTESSTATETAQTYGAATGAPVGKLHIASGANGLNNLTVEDKMYAAALGNEYLDNTGAAAIISAWETRHGNTYI